MVVRCGARDWWPQASPSGQTRANAAQGSEIVITLRRSSASGEWNKGLGSKRMFQDIRIPLILDDDQAAAGKDAL